MLLVLTIAGVFMGCFLGFLGRLANFSDGTILLVSFPGEILMRLLKMFILPLIISSLIAGESVGKLRGASTLKEGRTLSDVFNKVIRNSEDDEKDISVRFRLRIGGSRIRMV